MDAREKIDATIEFLKSRKVAEPTAAPPLWRLLWRLGFLLPPPHFLGFFTVALLTGVPFGVGTSLVFLPIFYGLGFRIEWWMGAAWVALGAFFGLSLATFYHRSARRLNLPEWSNFDPHFEAIEDTW